jgi:phenylacetate-CoA ligase
MTVNEIPSSLKERVPLVKPEWLELCRFMGEHPHAPRWNTQCGDRLQEADLEFVRDYALTLEKRAGFDEHPPDSIIEWCRALVPRSGFFRQRISSPDIARDWQKIVPMTRMDMQSKLELIIPLDADLSRLVINPTSGTTGHPIPAPNHPAAVGCYDPLIQYSLRMNGLSESCYGPRVAAIQVCAQKKTITYHTVHSYMDGAGFAKVNLHDWRGQSPSLYMNAMQPVFLSGDPYSFLEYINTGIEYRPHALLTTALTLERHLRNKLEEYFRCPVVDMYSLNETGPIAYSCPHDPQKFHILPHDIFVEILDECGAPLPAGEHGRIAVTGGRNPYLPLLRYLTGDRASMQYGICSCGETSPALTNLEGRSLVIFRKLDGSAVNAVDISGIVRNFPVYFFRFVQSPDYSCELGLCAAAGFTESSRNMMHRMISELFGSGIGINISTGLNAAEKFVPFTCELS